MPIRIYALAKELKIDSKELVDVCKKAGLTGKGSALASLTDDEVVKLKAYLNGGGKKGAGAVPPSAAATRAPAADRPVTRDDYVAPAGSQNTGRPRVLESKPKPKKASPSDAPGSDESVTSESPGASPSSAAPIAPSSPSSSNDSPKAPAEEPAVAQSTPASDSPASPLVSDDSPPATEKPAPPKRPLSRPSLDPGAPIRPVRPVAKPKPTPAKKERTKSPAKPAAKRGPVVKLAAIPQVEQPTPEPVASDEPAPQKPIMTLPKEAIRGAKEGTSAPLQKFTKEQDRKRAQEKMEAGLPPLTDYTGGPDTTGKGRRKKKERDDRPGEGAEPRKKSGLAGMANVRVNRQSGRRRSADGAPIRRRTSRLTRRGTNTAAPRKGSVVIQLPCTIRSFSEATGIPAVGILRSLMSMGVPATNINAVLEIDIAEMMAEEAGVQVDFREQESLEDTLISQLEEQADDPDTLVARPPVVTFLGHVDHGKTSLLDRIIGINVVSGEAGGITQHIRAYAIEKDGRTISFVDTPGHEAFTEMRARGANVTDIAVLVVAADDGVMPQTEEAISHARAAEVPIVVALNKIDLPGADVNKAYQDLSTHGLLPTEWGGDVEVIKTSAITGDGIDDLLETLLLTADIHEYRANPDRPALGTCLEAQQEPGRGVVAKLIVQAGTLRVGDVVVCGPAHGRVKAMYDPLYSKRKMQEAGPSIPVSLTGLDLAPGAGDRFHVLEDISKAREIAESRSHSARTESLAGRGSTRISFEEFQRRLEDGVLGESDEIVVLNMILRADVRGSIEAIQKELSKLDHPEVQIKLLQASVGGITVADVTLADASDAVVIGFNVIPDEAARAQADARGVEIRRYDIIYKMTEDIKAMLEGKLRPDEEVVDLGRALVQRTFVISRLGTIAGCRVLAGAIERGCRIRVNRDGRGIGDYALDSLKREKDDAKEVREGYECGIKLSGFNDLKEGDILEAYKIEEIARTL